MNYHNTYILLCCLIIYSCVKISLTGFVFILSCTYLILMLEEQTNQVYCQNSVSNVSAKKSLEDEEEIEEQKYTKNPRKKTQLKVVEQERDNDETVDVDVHENIKPSPYQHSYEQRKRFLESVYLDLEESNKWKTQKNSNDSIRGKVTNKI